MVYMVYMILGYANITSFIGRHQQRVINKDNIPIFVYSINEYYLYTIYIYHIDFLQFECFAIWRFLGSNLALKGSHGVTDYKICMPELPSQD